MKSQKILTIFILIILFLSSILVLSASSIKTISSNNKEDEDVTQIRVAIYVDTEENKEIVLTKNYNFRKALENYSWKVGNKTYKFVLSYLTLEDLKNKILTKENFDMVLNHYLAVLSFKNPLKETNIEKKAFKEFIEQGGGYYGSCASSMVTGHMTNIPLTSGERLWKKRMLGISGYNIDLQMFGPMDYMFRTKPLDPMQHYEPFWYYHGLKSEKGLSNKSSQCGFPIDFNINKKHPIFDDIIGNIRRMQYYDAPLLSIPENPDRELEVLASFPDKELSDNKSTQIHYWKYTGGLKGIISCLLSKHNSEYSDLSLRKYIEAFAEDWEPTDTVIPTFHANKPYLTSEFYPNENKGRIISSPGHPEAPIWWGGHIVEVDTDHNNLANGFFHWEDTKPYEETPEDEYTYNYCLIRRIVAWVSKVPDNNLPPIYGESEVCDFENDKNSLVFNVTGNCKTSNNKTSLDLYYRFSEDNQIWTEWTLFDNDNDSSDGWSWEFNSPNGMGYYEFYSIRKVEYNEIEKVPPGADSFVFVEGC